MQQFPWLILLPPVLIANFLVLWLLARRLRKRFQVLWDQLGRPHGVFSGNWQAWKANARLSWFVWKRGYVDLVDRQITIMVWCARITAALGVLVGLSIEISNR